MIIFKGFQGLENFYIKFQDFPYFSRICMNPAINIIGNIQLLLLNKTQILKNNVGRHSF